MSGITATIPAKRVPLARVCFDGSGVVAIKSSFNVSSITDNGTGDYTVNFSNNLDDADFETVLGCGDIGGYAAIPTLHPTAPKAVGSVRLALWDETKNVNGKGDADNISVSVYRGD